MARQITLDQAEAVIAACKQEAVSVGQPMNIEVVDDGGNLVAFAAMAGGVGVSAGTVDEDDQVARAGAAAYSS